MSENLSTALNLLKTTILFALLLIPLGMFAQVDDPSKEKERKLALEKFKPVDTTQVLKKPEIYFRNINIIPYYYQPAQLARVKRLRLTKQWNEMFILLTDYVSSFGIENFKDMSLVWQLARLSEYLGHVEFAKDLYRLILKHHRGDLQKALEHYDSLTQFEKPLYADLEYYYKFVELRKSIDTLKPPQDVLLNMGEEINSAHDDYAVTVTGPSDNQIFFSSKRNLTIGQSLLNVKNRYNEDLFMSQKDADDFWSQASPLEGLNTEYNEGSPCMSRDGKELIFVRCYSPEGFGDCDLFISKKMEDGKWSKAENLGSEINSPSWDSHPAFSITGDTLYFASARRGGFGGTDIYITVRDSTGMFETPLNLGPVVNTRGKEVSPFPHPRYNLLYFSSDNHLLNFGGFDIFKSYQINGEWSEPKNIGPLVNSEGDEVYFSIDTQSKWLFYAKSVEDDGTNLDLYSFPLPMEAKPNNIVRLTGIVREPVTGQIFSGVVTVIDMSEGTEVAPRLIRDDGSFEFELINRREYMILIEGDNFFNIEELLYMEGDTTVTFDAIPIKNIVFSSIDFESGSSELLPEMENNLHQVIDFLTSRREYNIRVIGHTDTDGDASMNLQLSQDRANAIKEYIISYGGLYNSRVTAIGKGSTEPIVPDAQKETEKKINRRVEFQIVPRLAESDDF